MGGMKRNPISGSSITSGGTAFETPRKVWRAYTAMVVGGSSAFALLVRRETSRLTTMPRRNRLTKPTLP